jgi:hypothetical protein
MDVAGPAGFGLLSAVLPLVAPAALVGKLLAATSQFHGNVTPLR